MVIYYQAVRAGHPIHFFIDFCDSFGNISKRYGPELLSTTFMTVKRMI
jgi:hypothetical protein